MLIGSRTFSAAADLAAVVRDYDLGILIGEETGGVRCSYGESLNFSLPYSKISYGISSKRFHAPNPSPDDDQRGTVPHVPIDETGLAPHLDDADPVLSFALEHVSR